MVYVNGIPVLVGLVKYERLDHSFQATRSQERELFLPLLRRCLEDNERIRPSSSELILQMKFIESILKYSEGPWPFGSFYLSDLVSKFIQFNNESLLFQQKLQDIVPVTVVGRTKFKN